MIGVRNNTTNACVSPQDSYLLGRTLLWPLIDDIKSSQGQNEEHVAHLHFSLIWYRVKQRFRELFEKLDINHDGKIEVKELAAGLQKLKGVTSYDSAGHAQVCVLGSVQCLTKLGIHATHGIMSMLVRTFSI